MSLLRDLWNDPDPVKWVIFGGLGVAVLLGGGLYWQTGKSRELQEIIDTHRHVPKNPTDPPKRDSLQQLLERADQLSGYMKQIQDDPFASDEDPANYASNYVIKKGTPAGVSDPKVTANVKGGSTGYSDTEISVTFPNSKSYLRENIYKFLYNMELSPLVVTTFVSWNPAERNHRAGQVLPADHQDQWFFESKFTVRRPKVQALPKPN